MTTSTVSATVTPGDSRKEESGLMYFSKSTAIEMNCCKNSRITWDSLQDTAIYFHVAVASFIWNVTKPCTVYTDGKP